MIYNKKKEYVTCIGACCPIKTECYRYVNLGKILGSACVNPPYKVTKSNTVCELYKSVK